MPNDTATSVQDIPAYMARVGSAARAAATAMAASPTQARNAALVELARLLRASVAALDVDNARDLDAARANGLAGPLLDRLKLGAKVIDTVAEGCEQLAAMPDPIGEITGVKRRPTGISVGQMRVPLGVFGMIYESRPNVTIEAACLAIKSGNACILRGGSEALHSNLALWQCVQAALTEAGLPAHAVQQVPTTDREAVGLLKDVEEKETRYNRELLETRDNPRVSAKQAVGTIIAAIHGIVTFPKHTRTMDWIDTLVIAEHAIDALLHSWRTGEHVP